MGLIRQIPDGVVTKGNTRLVMGGIEVRAILLNVIPPALVDVAKEASGARGQTRSAPHSRSPGRGGHESSSQAKGEGLDGW
jgi:hypothetical protein